MKKNDIIELEIDKYAFEGKGIAKVDRSDEDVDGKKFVVFVNGTYPGDFVSAELRKVKKSYAEARVDKIITPSPDRVNARCTFFGTCGGCKQQDLNYNKQLKYKSEQVKDVFLRIGGFEDFEFDEIEGADNIFYYRNKMEFSFADKRWITKDEIKSGEEITDRNFALGLHIPRMFDKVLNVDECFLQSEISNGILNFTREFFKSRGTSIYTTKTHEGYLRNLIIRQAFKTGDLMINLVTSEDDEKLVDEYTAELLHKFSAVTTVVNNISTKKSLISLGDYEKIYHGSGAIFDFLGNCKFRISANSFFQTNTRQAEKLYETAAQFAGISNEDIVYDLFSGAGTIAIFIAGNAKFVYGFESIDSAVKDAYENLKLNDVKNAEFFECNLNKSFRPLLAEKGIPKPDIIIADPPRGGMNPRTVRDILDLKPVKIVYISCNPATQARDIKLLTEGGYKLVKIKPVDMFPHTFHIENVALLIYSS